jgi:hypothetical protein
MYGVMPGLLCNRQSLRYGADAQPKGILPSVHPAKLGRYIWNVAQLTLLFLVGNGYCKAPLRKSVHLQMCKLTCLPLKPGVCPQLSQLLNQASAIC